MLKGRLGLESARIPHVDRHGIMWLARGNLYVERGTLRFLTAGMPDGLPAGDYSLPFQMVSCLLLQPGTTVTHDALRLLHRHDTTLVFCGQDGVRFYASLPAGPDAAKRARCQAEAWANPAQRILIVRRMYAWRLGEVFPATDLDALRGMEGARMKKTYQLLAQQYGVDWAGRRYDRFDPEKADLANQAINHAASAVEGAALTAVAAVGAVPQLGFIHEESGNAFGLDVADLFRDQVLLPIAFGAVKEVLRGAGSLERQVRRLAGEAFRREHVVPAMIDRIKELLDADDRGSDA